ncbi:hypothetical protein EF902_18460 [Streptomyces sp. WAC05858]|nr:hypothetical protein EF902_18460 [Streptomyces sp. WAC05858]
MDSIDEVHVSEPGLVVLDITARDEETAAAVMSRLDELWATSGVQPVRRVAGEPGVRALRLPRMSSALVGRLHPGWRWSASSLWSALPAHPPQPRRDPTPDRPTHKPPPHPGRPHPALADMAPPTPAPGPCQSLQTTRTQPLSWSAVTANTVAVLRPRAARPALVTRMDLLRREGGEVGSTNDVMGPPAIAIRRRPLDVQYGRAVVIHCWMITVH